MNNPDLIVQSNGCPIITTGPGPGWPVGSGNHNATFSYINQTNPNTQGFIDSSYLA